MVQENFGAKPKMSNTAKGDWMQIKGAVKQKWGKITDDELTEIDGSIEKLAGKLVSKYNMTKEEAKAEVARFWS